jgi:hypothetical protein
MGRDTHVKCLSVGDMCRVSAIKWLYSVTSAYYISPLILNDSAARPAPFLFWSTSVFDAVSDIFIYSDYDYLSAD